MFFIKKNSTLPKIRVEVISDGRNTYRLNDSGLNGSTATFSLIHSKTEQYILIDSPATIISDDSNPTKYFIEYQLSTRITKNVGKYYGEFKITYPNTEAVLPIKNKIIISVSDSFSDSSICCK